MELSEARYFEMNRVGWDRRAAVHVESKFYDVDGFVAGAASLREIELAKHAGLPERIYDDEKPERHR